MPPWGTVIVTRFRAEETGDAEPAYFACTPAHEVGDALNTLEAGSRPNLPALPVHYAPCTHSQQEYFAHA